MDETTKYSATHWSGKLRIAVFHGSVLNTYGNLMGSEDIAAHFISQIMLDSP